MRVRVRIRWKRSGTRLARRLRRCLEPLTVVALLTAFWRLLDDLRRGGPAGEGMWSRWQVWFGLAVVSLLAAWRLKHHGSGDGEAMP
jgi:hypothetical protein